MKHDDYINIIKKKIASLEVQQLTEREDMFNTHGGNSLSSRLSIERMRCAATAINALSDVLKDIEFQYENEKTIN